MEKLGLAFAVCPASDESAPPGLPPEERVVALARCKAEEVASKYPDRLVIGADTLVEVDGEALGKPWSQDEAVSMLLRLQGRVHHVWTGVWACSPGKAGGFADGTEVEFYPMSRREAEAYAATGRARSTRREPTGSRGGACAMSAGSGGIFTALWACRRPAPALPAGRIRLRGGVTPPLRENRKKKPNIL